MSKKKNRYSRIIEKVFLKYYKDGTEEVPFQRQDIEEAATELGIPLPKNLGDIIYSFRYRTDLPQSISDKSPQGRNWIIRPAGQGRYQFAAVPITVIRPSDMLVETKIPDSTPGVIDKYALNDEQALLAKLRYNRLIDIFTGITCYSL